MYSENQRISLRQLKRLIVFDIFSIGILIVPRLVAYRTGYDGIPAILLGTLIAFLFTFLMTFFLKCIGRSYYRYSQNGLGKIITFVLFLFYVAKWLFTCVVLVKLFSTVVERTLLEETDERLIIIAMVLVAGYASYKGCEVRARLTELLYFIVLVPILIFAICSLNQIDLANLTPVFHTTINNTWSGSYALFMIFNVLELLLFIRPYLRITPKGKQSIGKMCSYSVQGVFISAVYLLLFFVLTVGAIGEKAVNASVYSAVRVIQTMKFPGTLLNRQDSIFLGLWLFSIFALVSGLFFYLLTTLKHMFHVGNSYDILPIILVLVMLLAMCPMNLEMMCYWYERYMFYIGLPQSILIPVIIIVVNKIRRKGPVLIVLMLVPLCLQGCSKHTEIEDRDFIQVLGIDEDEGQVKTNFVLPDLNEMTKQGPTEDKEKLIKTFIGKDYLAIEEQYKLQSDKVLDYNHLKVIVLGIEFAKDPIQMKKFLDYVESNYQIAGNTLIFIADDAAEDIIRENGSIEHGIGNYLERIYQNNLGNRNKKKVTLDSVINCKNEEDLSVFIPRLKKVDKALYVDGECVFSQGFAMLEISSAQSVFTDMICGYGEQCRFFLPSASSKEPAFVVTLNNIHTNTKVAHASGRPTLHITIEAQGVMEKGMKKYANASAKKKAEIYKEVEQYLNTQVKEDIEKQVKNIMNQGVDYLNIYRNLRYKNRLLFYQYENRQSSLLKDMRYDINVSVHILG